jgi:hypothetical protein
METAIQLKEGIVLKRSKRSEKSKFNGLVIYLFSIFLKFFYANSLIFRNIGKKISKAENLNKPEAKKLVNINAQVFTSKSTSKTGNLKNSSLSILSKPPVKLSPKPKSKKSKLSNSSSKESISPICSKSNFANSHITKTIDKNSIGQNFPQKPALLKGKVNLDQNKPKKFNTKNKTSTSSKKSPDGATINVVKMLNTESADKKKVAGKVKVKAQNAKNQALQVPILQDITSTLNGIKSDSSKIPATTGIKNSKNISSSDDKFTEYLSNRKLNSIPKNLDNTANDDQPAGITEKLIESKEIYTNNRKLKIPINLVKKENISKESQSTSKHLNSIHPEVKDNCLRNHMITPNASMPILVKGIAQKSSVKLILRDNIEKKVHKSGKLDSNQPTRQKDKNVAFRKLFNPKKDKAISSNKPQNQVLRQKVKYQDSLMLEIQRLEDLIEFGNNLADIDITEWKRLVLNHNQLMSIYKIVILNHYETFNKTNTSWLRKSWETGTSKLLDQLNRIDIAKNKLKYALIRAVISHSEQILNDICITTNEFSEFEGLRQLILGGLGVNKVKNCLFDIKIGQNENAKQVLIDSTRNHLFKAISLNPNLGSAYHQLALFSILLNTKDILPCMLLYSIGSVSDCFESSTNKVLDELYQQCNWDSSPLHSLLQIFCKLATGKSEEQLGDQISKWTKSNRYTNWSCIDLFNLTVVGLISYTSFKRDFVGLKYENDAEIPLIQLILALFDTNIRKLNKQQTEADHTLLIHSILNFYLWIDCNKIYPCQFDYSDPNPISLSEGWSTIVNGLNLFYFNFTGWDYRNVINDCTSNSTPMSWLDVFKSKIAYILGQKNTQAPELDDSSNLNRTPSDCVKTILDLGLSWTRVSI